MKRLLLPCCLLPFLCGNALSSTLTYQGFLGQLDYETVNLGGDARVEPLFLMNGVVSGIIASDELEVVGTGNRRFAGQASGTIDALFAPDGFEVDLRVTARAECLLNPTAGSCPAGVTTNGELEIDFIPDADATLAVSLVWEGSDGGGVSIVDFFSLQLLRATGNPFNPEELIDISTNFSGNTQEGDSLVTDIPLLAGNNYTFRFTNRTNAISSSTDVLSIDFGELMFSARVIPEPGSFAMMSLALLTSSATARRRS